jgi:hypothetical protein
LYHTADTMPHLVISSFKYQKTECGHVFVGIQRLPQDSIVPGYQPVATVSPVRDTQVGVNWKGILIIREVLNL